jgi:ABC-type transport system involved in multi-copper enzyme maturation permease subunit
MVIETEILPFLDWLRGGGENESLGALARFGLIALTVAIVALIIGYLIAAVRHGPIAGGDVTYKVVIGGLRELPRISLRRLFALARLTVYESLRRHVWATLLVFLLILAFAGWFLGSNEGESIKYDPLKIYVSFVLTGTTYLVLLMALFLSTFSLPNDIKNKTIYTVVTKPVRAGEIVLGRLLGFAFIGTALLSLMGLFSYIFVVRAVSHTHQLAPQSLENSEDGGKHGFTDSAVYHRHEVFLNEEGAGRTESVQGHSHAVSAHDSPQGTQYEVGPPDDLFRARVPVLGKLRFKDRVGEDKPRGISVGSEWTYRSYIEGGSQAAAIWTFNDVRPERYPDGYLPVELTIRVFRSYIGAKESVEKGIYGGLVLRNPHTGLESEQQLFRAKDFYIDVHEINRRIYDKAGNVIDIFDDLTHNGQLEIQIQCLEGEQYFGMAQADCYLRPRDRSFTLNFIKGFIGIWVQMMIVLAIGTAGSTFVGGPVAMLLTVSVVVMGLFRNFMLMISLGENYGGGPIEALIRTLTRNNLVSDLNVGPTMETIIKSSDVVITYPLRVVSYVLPDFNHLSKVRWVAEGFDVPVTLTSQDVVVALAYVLGMFVVGYFFLRTREVAK